MKLLIFLCLIGSLVAVTLAADALWTTEYLLYKETIVRHPQWNEYQHVIVEYPKPGERNNHIISSIFVDDNFSNKTGAVASLWSGGPYYKYARMTLKGLYSKGFNSTITIYGRQWFQKDTEK